jgi:hypothetical protein
VPRRCWFVIALLLRFQKEHAPRQLRGNEVRSRKPKCHLAIRKKSETKLGKVCSVSGTSSDLAHPFWESLTLTLALLAQTGITICFF